MRSIAKFAVVGLVLMVALTLGAIRIADMLAPPIVTQSASGRNAPLPTPTRRGLGVTRSRVQSIFQEKLRYSFEPPSDYLGQPCVWGMPDDYSLADVELIGPEEELLEVSMLIALDKDKPLEGALNSIRMQTLLEVVVPDWEAGPEWLIRNARIAVTGGRVETSHGGLSIRLQTVQKGTLGLRISAR